MMKEVEIANRDAIAKKEVKKQEEKAFELEIVEYNRKRAAKEAELAAEKQRIKEEKEREVQRLRDLQEKAADRQSEIDALRAKRAFEERERAAREEERRIAAKKSAVIQELEVAREKQFRDKDLRMAEQAKAERDEFLAIISRQKEDEEAEKRLGREKKEALYRHSNTLRS